MPDPTIPADLEKDKEPEIRWVLKEDPKALTNRITLFRWVVLAVFLYLLAGFWALQIRDPDYYDELAEKNYVRSQPLPAPGAGFLTATGE